MDTKKVAELLKDEEFVEKIFTTATPKELKSLFEENGVNLKEEELKNLIDSIQTKMEESVSLSETDLQTISGGENLSKAEISVPKNMSSEQITDFINKMDSQI